MKYALLYASLTALFGLLFLPVSSSTLEWKYATYHTEMIEEVYLYTLANGTPRHWMCREITQGDVNAFY